MIKNIILTILILSNILTIIFISPQKSKIILRQKGEISSLEYSLENEKMLRDYDRSWADSQITTLEHNKEECKYAQENYYNILEQNIKLREQIKKGK